MKTYILRGCFLSFFPSSEDYSLSTKDLPVLYIFRSTMLRNLPCGLPPETPQPVLGEVCLCYRHEDKSVFVYVHVLAPNWVCLGQKRSQLEMISYSQAVYLSQQGAGPEDCMWGIHISLCTSETAVAHEGVCEHTPTSRGTPRPFNQVSIFGPPSCSPRSLGGGGVISCFSPGGLRKVSVCCTDG